MSFDIVSGPMLAAFLAASFVLAVTPGPGVVYIVARTLAQGRGAGLASVAGVAAGNLCNAVGAALGLAALFAVSSLAFSVVKYAGAAYLIYLGIKALRRPATVASPAQFAPPQKRRIARDGFLVALLNPKTALFFAAFLPQFIDPAGSAALQGAMLGVVFVAIAALTDSAYVLAASLAGARIGRGRRFETAGPLCRRRHLLRPRSLHRGHRLEKQPLRAPHARRKERKTMCRNIRTLFNFEPPATEIEIRDAALQFVRKISGFTVPSRANEAAFDRAVEDVAAAARSLISSLVTTADPRDREVEAARARARSAARFGPETSASVAQTGLKREIGDEARPSLPCNPRFAGADCTVRPQHVQERRRVVGREQ